MLEMNILQRWANLLIYKLLCSIYYPLGRSMLSPYPCCTQLTTISCANSGLATFIGVLQPHNKPVGNQGSFRRLRGCGLGTLVEASGGCSSLA